MLKINDRVTVKATGATAVVITLPVKGDNYIVRLENGRALVVEESEMEKVES